MNLEISVESGSASVVLAVLVTQLSLYLHFAMHQNHPLTTPLLLLIIILSALFGAVQVVAIRCNKCACEHVDAKEVEEEEETHEVEDDEEEEADDDEEDDEDAEDGEADNEAEDDGGWASPEAAVAVRAAAARGDVDEVLRLIDCGARPALYSPPSRTWEPAVNQLLAERSLEQLPAERSLEQLREFAAKINEMNLNRVCEYKPEVLNPEDLFEPRPSPKAEPVLENLIEAALESELPPLVDSESTS
jgi:hypothetical protein